MSLKSAGGHLLNGASEIVSSKWAGKYLINSGVDHGLSKTHYNERLVELPFLFKHIRKAPAKVLDLGCVESIVPIQLAMMGYDVTGIDIREYGYAHPNFTFIKSDFLSHKFSGKFDTVVDISSIEHFGLESYGYEKEDRRGDLVAMGRINSLLGKGGQLIFTAPYGVKEVIGTFQRIYNAGDIKEMMKGFRITDIDYYRISDHKKVQKIKESTAASVKYKPNDYACVLVNATKI